MRTVMDFPAVSLQRWMPASCWAPALHPAPYSLHPIAGYLPGYPTGFPPGPDAGYGMSGPDAYGMSVGGPWGGGAHVAGPPSHALPHGHSHGHVPTPAGGALLHVPHAPGTYYQASVGDCMGACNSLCVRGGGGSRC